jgi:hypothetical protein
MTNSTELLCSATEQIQVDSRHGSTFTLSLYQRDAVALRDWRPVKDQRWLLSRSAGAPDRTAEVFNLGSPNLGQAPA